MPKVLSNCKHCDGIFEFYLSELSKQQTYCSRKCYSEDTRMKYGESSRNFLILKYKQSAKIRNHEWALTKKQAEELFQGDCFFCGSKPKAIISVKTGYGEYIYNGIDRFDNNKGYTIENSVSCCKECNSMKSNKTVEEFLDHIEKVYQHMASENAQKALDEVLGRLQWKIAT